MLSDSGPVACQRRAGATRLNIAVRLTLQQNNRFRRPIGIRQADLQRISPVARKVHGHQKRTPRRSRQVLDDGPAPSPEGFDNRHRILPAPGELRRPRKLLPADHLLVRMEPADQLEDLDVARMTAALVDLFCRFFPTPPAAITLDIDDACDPVHGHQQLSLFHEGRMGWDMRARPACRAPLNANGGLPPRREPPARLGGA